MGGGRDSKKEGIYVYLWLIHVDVWQKLTQYCKEINLQLKLKTEQRSSSWSRYVPLRSSVCAVRYSGEFDSESPGSQCKKGNAIYHSTDEAEASCLRDARLWLLLKKERTFLSRQVDDAYLHSS